MGHISAWMIMRSIPRRAVARARAQRRFLSSIRNFLSRSLYRLSPSIGLVRLPGIDRGTDICESALLPWIKPSQLTQSILGAPCTLWLIIFISSAHPRTLSLCSRSSECPVRKAAPSLFCVAHESSGLPQHLASTSSP